MFLLAPLVTETRRTPRCSRNCFTLKLSILTPIEPVMVEGCATIQSLAAAA